MSLCLQWRWRWASRPRTTPTRKLSPSMGDVVDRQPYALAVADSSYDWYRSRAILARRAYRLADSAIVVLSAAVPLAAILAPGDAYIAGVLGFGVVVISGMASLHQWRDNYYRF